MKVTWDAFIYVNCMDKSYLRCFCLCLSSLFVLMKVTWHAFCLCFKCLEFLLYKKKKKIKNCPDSLNIYTTNANEIFQKIVT